MILEFITPTDIQPEALINECHSTFTYIKYHTI